jgi:endonuclease/exonuclease/phosphatase family metal-dependent hydrolase
MLRVLSANLMYGRADAGALVELVRALDVAVVAVQELGPRQAEVLSAWLPHGKLEPTADGMGLGVALRHPGEVERLPLPKRDAHVARLTPADWPGLARNVEIVNAHLANPVIGVPAGWRHRRGQVAGLAAYLASAEPCPRALVGDLNSTPRWPAYRRLVTELDDAAVLAAARSGRAPAPTWGPYPGAPRLLRIDHVLVDAFDVLDFRVFRLPGSDHSAVVADLAV